jgi:hypothetical protein
MNRSGAELPLPAIAVKRCQHHDIEDHAQTAENQQYVHNQPPDKVRYCHWTLQHVMLA